MSDSVNIVGSGIVGLISAYKVHQKLRIPVRVYDAGPDPRAQRNHFHSFGASYSGLDARHISITETGPWTDASREELIERSPAEGGWNCLASVTKNQYEAAWQQEFKSIARDADRHATNSQQVFAANKEGLMAWAELHRRKPKLFAPIFDTNYLTIICTNEADLVDEYEGEKRLDEGRVKNLQHTMPVGYEPLDQKFRDGILHGSFTVAGNAYNIRKLCVNVIDYLEEHGVEFHWRNPISLVDGGDRVTELPPGDIVWASGVSGGMSSFLADKKILLQGVLGCWVDIPNQGFSHPFKIYGKEPTNFINATPIGNRLLLSGGYGWVGTRAHAEVTKLAKPTMQAFLHEVSKFFFDGRALSDKYPLATCIRPSLPSGVTQIEEITYQDRRVVTCIGHSAGGFTQSAHVADVVVEKLSS